MSSIFEDAHVSVFVGDYIAVDAGGKLNAIGLGFTAVGIQQTGLSSPMCVATIIDLPRKHAGSEFSLSIELRDTDADEAVKVPGPSGQLEALRVQQVARVDPAQSPVPGVYLPPDMPSRVQAILAFAAGLPLRPGGNYAFRIEIEGSHRKHWIAPFHVLGPPPGPVFGGPVGPADIPTVNPPS